MAGKRKQRDAFTLLEVILAIAILGVSIVAIGNVTRNAYRNAESATIELEARLVAESVMGEVLAGGRELVSAPLAPLQTDIGSTPAYSYAIIVEPTVQPNLLSVRVQVTKVDADPGSVPLCEIGRWKIDPNYLSSVAAANTTE